MFHRRSPSAIALHTTRSGAPRATPMVQTPAQTLAQALTLVFGLAVSAPLLTAPAHANTPAAAQINPPSRNVAWLPAAQDADIDRAFAQARQQRKPVLLYWGATWCPPCNQLKATFFNTQDFAIQARDFVAVHIDGDRPGAQKLGARFKVRGYPTVILMNPEGAEITRLPGEADGQQVMAVLRAGLAGGRPISAVLADARAGKTLSPNEWRTLAYYSWDTDEAQLVPAADRPHLLAELAARVPAAQAETATRMWLKALATSDDARGLKPDAALRAGVDAVLADAAATKLHLDVLTGGGARMVQTLTGEGTPERAALAARMDAALVRAQADASLSRGDLTQVVIERIAVARIGQGRDTLKPRLPDELVRLARDHATRMDREITDGYERQAVITSAAYLLGQAGLWEDSDALLKANLARSHSPYYLMSQLGGNARRQGRTDEALNWYRQSFERSVGPATRLQWGAGYFQALVDLAPQDAARIESVAAQLFKEAGEDSASFHERSARSLQRVTGKLRDWNKGPQQAAVVQRLERQLQGVCGKLPADDPQRATCLGLIKA